jgi:hypothetical protein
MKPLSKLQVIHGGITALAFVLAAVVGVNASTANFVLALIAAFVFSFLSWLALGWLLPGARLPDSHWREPLSDPAGKRIMGFALRAPFYLLALFLVVVIVLGLRARG